MTDTKFKVVADWNVTKFFDEVTDALSKGYYADDSVAGYPYLAGPFEIRLFQGEQPAQRHDLSKINEVYIQGYDNTTFFLDVQDALLQGFAVSAESISVGTPHGVKLLRVGKAVELPVAVVEEEAVPSPTLDAEDAKSEAVEALTDVLKDVAETKEVSPAKPAKTPRKTKEA